MTIQPASTARAPGSRMSAFEVEKAAHLLRLRLQMASLKTASASSTSNPLLDFSMAPKEPVAATAMQADSISPVADVKPLPGQLIGLGLPGLDDGSSASFVSWDEQPASPFSERILVEQTAPAQPKSPSLTQVAQAASTPSSRSSSSSKKPKLSSHRRTPSASRAQEPSLYEAIFGDKVDLKPAGPGAVRRHPRTPSASGSGSAAAAASSAHSSAAKPSGHSSPRSLSGVSLRLHVAASSPQLGSPRRTGGSGQFPPRHDPHNHPSWETQQREQRMVLQARTVGRGMSSDKAGEPSGSHEAFALPTVSPAKRKQDPTDAGPVITPPRRTPHNYPLGSGIVLPLGAGISPHRSVHSPRQRTVSQGADHGLLPNGHPASSLAQDLGLTNGSFRGRMPSTPRRLERMSNKTSDEPIGREHTQAETDHVASLLAAMADERGPSTSATGWNRPKGPSPLSGRGLSTPTKLDPSTPTKVHHRLSSSSFPSHRENEETVESAAMSLLFFAHSPSSASSSRFPGTTPSLLGAAVRSSDVLSGNGRSRTSTPDARMWRPSAPARTLFSDENASRASPSALRGKRLGSSSSTASSLESSGVTANGSGSHRHTDGANESEMSTLTVLQESPDLDALSPESQRAKVYKMGTARSGSNSNEGMGMGVGAGGIFTPPPSTKKAAGSAAERAAHFERLVTAAVAPSSSDDSPPITPPRASGSGDRDRQVSATTTTPTTTMGTSLNHARRDSKGELLVGTPPPRSPSLQPRPPETPKAMGRFDYSAWVNVSPSPKMTRSRAPSGQFANFGELTPRLGEGSFGGGNGGGGGGGGGGWIESVWGQTQTPGPSPQLDRAMRAAQALNEAILTPSRAKRQRVATPDEMF